MILNVFQRTYSRYENNERAIPIEILSKLADFYGTNTDYLIGRTDVMKPYPKAKKPGRQRGIVYSKSKSTCLSSTIPEKRQKIKESCYQDSLISYALYPVLLPQTLQYLESHILLSRTVFQP